MHPWPWYLSRSNSLEIHSMVLNTGCTVFRDATVTGEQYPSYSKPNSAWANSLLQCQAATVSTLQYHATAVPIVQMYSTPRYSPTHCPPATVPSAFFFCCYSGQRFEAQIPLHFIVTSTYIIFFNPFFIWEVSKTSRKYYFQPKGHDIYS
jgi:hypothetical protein